MILTGRTILITGGGSGIGLALARTLIARGNTVLACGRNEQRLESARRAVPGLQTAVCDVTREADRRLVHALLRDRFGGLDVLINNTGTFAEADFASGLLDIAALERDIATNLTAPVRLIARLLPLLRERPEAVIVNVTSALAYMPMASMPVYSASKAALHSFTLSLRHQLSGTTIRVVEVPPPVVDTALQAGKDLPKVRPDVFARRVIDAIERGDTEIRVGWARALALLSRVAPGTLFRMLNRAPAGAAPALAPAEEVSHVA